MVMRCLYLSHHFWGLIGFFFCVYIYIYIYIAHLRKQKKNSHFTEKGVKGIPSVHLRLKCVCLLCFALFLQLLQAFLERLALKCTFQNFGNFCDINFERRFFRNENRIFFKYILIIFTYFTMSTRIIKNKVSNKYTINNIINFKANFCFQNEENIFKQALIT